MPMPRRVLLLEPDPMRQVGFRAALAASGYVGVAAETPLQAAALLREDAFHLVLLGPGQLPGELMHAEPDAPPVVTLALLPDCVIGHGHGDRKPPADLPAILEALTRYIRFAPPRTAETRAEAEKLLENWAKFEGGPS